MKTLKTVLILSFLLILTFSCKSDDDDSGLNNTEENRTNLLGTWKVTNEVYDGEEEELWICDLLGTTTFTSNTLTTKSYYDPSGNDGNNCMLDSDFTQNYTINGNVISTTEDGETFTGDIIQLTDTVLTIKFEYIDDGETHNEVTSYIKL